MHVIHLRRTVLFGPNIVRSRGFALGDKICNWRWKETPGWARFVIPPEYRHPAEASSSRRSVVIPPKAGNHGRRIGIANQPCRRHRDVDQERVPRPVAPIMSGHRSRHSAFPDLTSSIFLCRDHPLIVFSRRMASTMVLWSSCQTRVCTPYRFVKLSARASRCWQTRFARFDVTPTDRAHGGLLASM